MLRRVGSTPARLRPGGSQMCPPVQFSYNTIDYSYEVTPSPLDGRHFLRTDGGGTDLFAKLLYGFRLSVLFGIVLMIISSSIGVLVGALQGYLGGLVDLISQRVVVPEPSVAASVGAFGMLCRVLSRLVFLHAVVVLGVTLTCLSQCRSIRNSSISSSVSATKVSCLTGRTTLSGCGTRMLRLGRDYKKAKPITLLQRCRCPEWWSRKRTQNSNTTSILMSKKHSMNWQDRFRSATKLCRFGFRKSLERLDDTRSLCLQVVADDD